MSVVKSKANPIPTDENSTMNQSKYEAITCSWCQVRENAPVRVANGFGVASHWLRKWLEFSQQITEKSKAKTKQTQITFDNQLKTTLASVI